MPRAFLRAMVLTVGLVVMVEACSSSTTPPPTEPPAGVSQPPATQAPASVAPSTAGASASTAASAAPATPSAPAVPGLAGTWDGTWKNTTPDQSTGTFVLTWTQNGSALTGSIVVKGTPCVTGASITGSVSGSSISFGVVSGQIKIAYDGTISGTTMKGTYAAPATCADAKGSWEAVKK